MNADRHQRRTPPCPILAGIETFTAKRVGDESFDFKVALLPFGDEAGGHIYCTRSVAAAERFGQDGPNPYARPAAIRGQDGVRYLVT